MADEWTEPHITGHDGLFDTIIPDTTIPTAPTVSTIWDSIKQYWWLILILIAILYFMFRKRR
jgi:type II secretory pathway component PulF